MKPMFSDAGRFALHAALSRRCLLAFDFDGTLAPIVPEPETAATPPAIARRLAILSTLCPVAIISGRSFDDVRQRVGFTPSYVLGNHGAEGWADLDPLDTSRQLDGLRLILGLEAEALHELGVRIEDKRLSIALHYRAAPDQARALAAIDALLRDVTPPLVVFGGKLVVNVMPPDAPNKGLALEALVRLTGVETVIFVGDDLNDETAFELAPATWLTIRVGDDHAASAARYYVENHTQVTYLLQAMIDNMVAP